MSQRSPSGDVTATDLLREAKSVGLDGHLDPPTAQSILQRYGVTVPTPDSLHEVRVVADHKVLAACVEEGARLIGKTGPALAAGLLSILYRRSRLIPTEGCLTPEQITAAFDALSSGLPYITGKGVRDTAQKQGLSLAGNVPV
jgi:hypothetical protein